MYFTGSLERADSPPKRGFDVRKQEKHSRVTMFPLKDADKDATVNVLVITDECHASITLKITDSVDEAARIVKVVPRPESERVVWQKEQERQRTIARARPMAESSPVVIVPKKLTTRRNGGPMYVDISHGWWELRDLFLAFDIDNQDRNPGEVADLLVFRGDGRPVAADIVHVQQFAGSNDQRVAFIPARQKARGFVSLPNAAREDIRGLTIVLRDANGETLAVASVGDWESRRQILVPMSDEEIERQKRDEEARGRVSLHLQALGGYIWLEDGPALNELDATAFRGLSARVTYGFNRYVALEVEIAGGSSGKARFDMFDGMSGDVVRSAEFGRAYVGGLLRLGYKTIPIVRVGLGFQGARLATEVRADGSDAVTFSDKSLEFEGIVIVGGGLDIRLGESLVAWIAGTAVLRGVEELRALGASVHVGYSWKP